MGKFIKRTLISTVLSLVLSASNVHAAIDDEILLEGTMNCEIKSQNLLEIKDGQEAKYTSIENGLTVGDTFELKYIFDSWKISGDNPHTSSTFTIETKPFKFVDRRNFFVKRIHSYFRTKASAAKESDEKYHWYANENKTYLDMTSINRNYGGSQYMTIRPNSIEAGYIGEYSLNLTRYYKGDWVGVLNETNLIPGTHSATFSCKHSSSDIWQETFDTLKNKLHEALTDN